MIKYLCILIGVLLVSLYYCYTEMNRSRDIIYVFYKNDDKLCDELNKEWKKVEVELNSKKIKNKKICITNPIYTEWKTNYNIKSIPEIVRVRADGFRVKYEGKRLSENIIAWVFENKEV
jgi:hypothetical protein